MLKPKIFLRFSTSIAISVLNRLIFGRFSTLIPNYFNSISDNKHKITNTL